MLVGKHFDEGHNFKSPAILADGSAQTDFELKSYIENKYAILFFYTLDFSYICPTELYALGNRFKKFQQLNTEIIAISGDSHLSHAEWRNKPVEMGGVGELPFTMVSDISRKVARAYDVLINDSMSLRATFIIDPKGHFRYQAIHDLSIGRNIDEIIRVLEGLQTYQKTGKLLPAGWSQGQETLTPTQEHLSDYMVRNAANL